MRASRSHARSFLSVRRSDYQDSRLWPSRARVKVTQENVLVSNMHMQPAIVRAGDGHTWRCPENCRWL